MITIKDLAKHCNVSVSLVSRAFNGYDDINENTKQRILSAANELGYIPNTSARALSKKNNNKIAIIVRTTKINNFTDEIPLTYASESFLFANNLGFEAIILFTDIYKKKNEIEIKNHLRSLGITGVILFGVNNENDKLFFLAKTNDFKCVMIDTSFKNDNTSSIILDEVQAQYDVLNFQFDKKTFNNITYLSGALQSYTGIKRMEGVKKFCKDNKIVLNSIECNYNEEEAYNFIINNYSDTIEVIACANDIMAIGVVKALNYLNIKRIIPIIGFDGISLLNYINYPIITVQQNFKEKATLATQRMIDLFNNKNSEIIYCSYNIISNSNENFFNKQKAKSQ